MRRYLVPFISTLMGSAVIAAPATTKTTVPGVVKQAPGVYRFMLGEAEVIVLSDGTAPSDVHRMLKGPSPDEMDAALARNMMSNPVEGSNNVFVIRMGGRTILVDAGAGTMFGPDTFNRLPEALQIAGIKPEQVNDVLITHLHPDHFGGLIVNGQRAFPNAIVHASKPDMGLLDPKISGAPPLSQQVKAAIQPYLDAKRIVTFETDGEILPGITAELHPGHSPGATIYKVRSGGQELAIVGDLIHVAAIDLELPNVNFIFDWNPEMTRHDDEETLQRLASERTLVAAAHISFPGIGYFQENGKAFRWIPVQYGNSNPKAPPPKL